MPTDIDGQVLNLWSICREGTRALGPGLRYVLWTQGCLKRCPGCTSPESQPVEPKKVVDVDRMAADIVSRKEVTGITISGGEPFLQAASLARMLESVRQQRPELNVIVFTGFLLEELRWADAQALLAQTDVLIDGPYQQTRPAHRGLRGSQNQRIHFLTEALAEAREELEHGSRKLEIFVEDGNVVTIGIPRPAEEITKEL